MVEFVFLLLVAIVLYFAPAFFAYGRSHHQAGAILLLNLLLGWTFLGWVVALIWAFTAIRPPMAAEDKSAAAVAGKACPDCAETVKAGAQKCRFCGHEFDGEPPVSGVTADRSLLKSLP